MSVAHPPYLVNPTLIPAQVDGPLQNGIAQMHMVKRRGESDYEYKYLFIDIKGHDRIYLENAEDKTTSGKKQLSFFGVKW